MKKIFSFRELVIFLLFSISVFAFADNSRGDMVGLELTRVVTAADITTIAETESDILLVVDRETTVPSATCPFPANPRRGQLMGISTRVQITALTLDPGPSGRPIAGYTAPFQLNANTVLWWIYEDVADRWFRY